MLSCAVLLTVLTAVPVRAETFDVPESLCVPADSAPGLAAFIAGVPDGTAEQPVTIRFPAGITCRVAQTLDLNGRAGLILDLNGATIARPTAPESSVSSPTLLLADTTDITVTGGTITGAMIRGFKPAYDSTRAKYHAIRTLRAHTVLIEDLTIRNVHGDCVDVDGSSPGDGGPSTDVTIRNASCLGAGRQGISGSSVDGVLIDDVLFDFIARSAVDLEPRPATGVRNVTVQNSTFKWIGNFAIAGVGTSGIWENVVVQNNDHRYCDQMMPGIECFSNFAKVGNAFDRGPFIVRNNQLSGFITLKKMSGEATGNTVNRPLNGCFVTAVQSIVIPHFTVSGNQLPGGVDPLCESLAVPVIRLQPSAINFAPQTTGVVSAGRNLTVSNVGETELVTSEVRIGGPDAARFFVTSNGCTRTYANKSCSIQVAFASPEPGTFAATLELHDNEAGSPHLIPLSATASGPVTPIGPVISCGAADPDWRRENAKIPCAVLYPGAGLTDPADAAFELKTSVAQDTEDAAAVTDSRLVCATDGLCTLAGPVTGNRVDRKDPAVACEIPDSEWHPDNLTLVCSVADTGSGLKDPDLESFAATSDVPDGAETADASVTNPRICDVAGNCLSVGEVTVDGLKIDRAAPAVACDPHVEAWSAADVSTSCTAGDGGVGLAVPEDAAFSLSTAVPAGTETAGAATGTRSVCDLLGHCMTAGPIGGFRVDRLAPSITCTPPEPPWSVGLLVPCTAIDGGSGLAVPEDAAFDLVVAEIDGGLETDARQVCDGAGNCATAGPIAELPDTSPPAIDCASADALWHAADVMIACTASDDDSGLADPLDAAFTLATSVADGTETASTQTGTRQVCDVAGNCATAGPVGGIRVDRKGPVVTTSVAPVPNAAGWNRAAATVSFSCTDGGAGVLTCPVPVLRTADTSGLTIQRTATDAVGNATAASRTVKVDKVDPEVTLNGPDDGATYTQGSVPNATCSTTDALSGVDEPAGLDVSGGSGGLGTITASCEDAEDVAGNVAPDESVTYTVTAAAVIVNATSGSGFNPKVVTANQGQPVKWTFQGPGNQRLRDINGLGLFDTGARSPGQSFTFTFPGAGAFGYRDELRTSLTGTVNVLPKITPSSGSRSTSFTVQWAAVRPATGRVFDIQVKRPGSGTFVNLWTGQTTVSRSWTPDGATGTYTFRVRFRNAGTGRASGYSPPVVVTVR